MPFLSKNKTGHTGRQATGGHKDCLLDSVYLCVRVCACVRMFSSEVRNMPECMIVCKCADVSSLTCQRSNINVAYVHAGKHVNDKWGYNCSYSVFVCFLIHYPQHLTYVLFFYGNFFSLCDGRFDFVCAEQKYQCIYSLYTVKKSYLSNFKSLFQFCHHWHKCDLYQRLIEQLSAARLVLLTTDR